MNPAQLLAHFDRISEAPDAIPRLRRFILDLAVRGKLVEQDPNDEPVGELLKRIEAEKAKLLKAGEIRKEREFAPIRPNEQPFDSLNQWVWVRLGSVIHLVSGQHLQPPEYSEDKRAGIPYITGPSDFGQNGLIITRYALVRKAVAYKGQLLLTVKGSGVGKITICNLPEVAISRQLMAMTAIGWDSRFLVLVTHLLSETLRESARSLIPGIARENVEEFVIPLPPLPEQHRIVAKVDELMALCDQLEAAKTERESQRNRLITASLHHLNSSADTDASREHARFYLNHLPRLTTRPEHIKQLRQTILNLAVRGRLVPQDPNDEPAGELLKRIQSEKVSLVKKGILKKSKDLQLLNKEEIPFNLPPLWTATRLGVIYDVRDGTHDTPKYVDAGYPLITSKNLSTGRLSFEDIKFISEKDHQQISERSLVEKDNILFAMIGSIGNPVIVDTDRAFSIKNVALFKYFDRYASHPGFLCLFLKNAAGEMQKLAVGGLQPFVSLGFLRNYPIMLPPLPEQHRIVAKVDELMALCDQLESQLTTTQADSRRLLEAMLHRALGEHHTSWKRLGGVELT